MSESTAPSPKPSRHRLLTEARERLAQLATMLDIAIAESSPYPDDPQGDPDRQPRWLSGRLYTVQCLRVLQLVFGNDWRVPTNRGDVYLAAITECQRRGIPYSLVGSTLSVGGRTRDVSDEDPLSSLCRALLQLPKPLPVPTSRREGVPDQS